MVNNQSLFHLYTKMLHEHVLYIDETVTFRMLLTSTAGIVTSKLKRSFTLLSRWYSLKSVLQTAVLLQQEKFHPPQ